MLLKRTVCNKCAAEFEIEPLEDYPILFCPGCGAELEEEDEAEEVGDD